MCHGYIYPATDTNKVKKKKKVNGKFQKVTTDVPPVIRNYFAYMAGVDLSPISNFSATKIYKKTRKWWKTLFFHCLDVTAADVGLSSTANCHKVQRTMVFNWHLSGNSCKKSELQPVPNRSPGRTFRSSVGAVHCLFPITTKFLNDKSSKSTKGRGECKLCTIC